MALCLYLKGDLDGAIECAERVVGKIDGSNDFSLGMLVHYYLLRSREDEATEAARRMLQVRPADVTHLLKQVEALARLGRHEAVLRLTEDGMRRFPESREMLAFFAGAACANLSQVSRAASLLDEAAQDPMSGRLAAWYRGLIEKNRTPATLYVRWPYFEANYWLQIERLLVDFKSHAGKKEQEGSAAIKTLGGWKYFVDSLLIAGKAEPGGDPGFNATLAINLLGFCGSDEACAVLRDMAFGMFGSDETRNEAAAKLLENGKVPPDEPVQMFLGGEWREVVLKKVEIRDREPEDLPEEARDVYVKACMAAREGNQALAEELGRRLVELAPRWPAAHHNLAMSLLQQKGGKKKRRKEAGELLDRALELDPGYLFARCMKAQMLSRDGRHGEAMTLLDGVDIESGLTHPDEFAVYHGARLQVLHDRFVAEHGPEAILLPDHRVRAQVDELKEMSALARLIEKLPDSWNKDNLGRLVDMVLTAAAMLERGGARRSRTRRSRPVDVHGKLETLLGNYTVGELRRIALNLGIGIRQGLSKGALVGKVAKELSGTAQGGRLGPMAGERGAKVLEALLGAGGFLPVEEFSRRFDYDPDEDFLDPKTPAGKLRSMGLVHEGVILGKECVFVPGQLFPLARAVLKRG
jgi:tetratricopeptide (TPR) repeat protein